MIVGAMKMWAGLLFCLAVTAASGPGSCESSCGQVFSRAQVCSCDSDCQLHGDCCHDYQEACIDAVSCRGRCRETFRRGRQCDCDSNCSRYNTCCHDYPQHCDAGETVRRYQEVKPARRVIINMPSSQSDALSGSSGHAHIQLILKPSEQKPELCSDSPVDGVTALLNGTLVVFKGRWFWTVDPRTRQATPPRSVTDVLGVPAPVDTVFTRCNCEAKTYVIKGELYWVLDRHLVPEAGFPQRVSAGFSGLTGLITAALPLPASRAAPETVYFFKKGGFMQKYSFPAGARPDCSQTPPYSLRTASVQPPYRRQRHHQADVFLSGEINMAVSLKGFPALVTSALSSPSTARSPAYNHFVFSGPLFFNVLVSGDLPALAPPTPGMTPSLTPGLTLTLTPGHPRRDPLLPANSFRAWLQCAGPLRGPHLSSAMLNANVLHIESHNVA